MLQKHNGSRRTSAFDSPHFVALIAFVITLAMAQGATLGEIATFLMMLA